MSTNLHRSSGRADRGRDRGHTGEVGSNQREQDLLARLREMYPSGTALQPGCVVEDVLGSPGEAVLTLRCGRDPRTYGIPIPLGSTSRDYYDRANPVGSIDEWLESVRTGLSIQVGTGLHSRARRRLVNGYIELREADGWQYDSRFYLDIVEPDEPQSWDRLSLLREAGFDPAPALASRDQGRLIAWVTAYDDESPTNPYAGHAVVSWTGDETADLEHVEVRPGSPATLLVGLARRGAHFAGGAGALSVTTGLDNPELDLVGFRYGPDGRRAVDTGFLDEDPDGAAALLGEVLAAVDEPGASEQAGNRRRPDAPAGRRWSLSRRGAGNAAGDAG